MAENPTSRRAIVIGIVAVVVFVAIVAGTVIWALGRPRTTTMSDAELRTAFASAMQKAGVDATYPEGAPIPIESVETTGEHPFSATFTAEELTALLSAFSHNTTVNGTEASLKHATVRLAGVGALGISASVSADGKSYSASVEGPIAYESGSVSSPGATSANVEGITLNADQRAQLTAAVVEYLNSYLSSAPGLRMGTARVTADGVVVTGVAPDSLTYP